MKHSTRVLRGNYLLTLLMYAVIAASGIVSMFTPTVLDALVQRPFIVAWQAFVAIGAIVTAVSPITDKPHFALIGLPLVMTGLTVYAIFLMISAATLGRGWGVALLCLALVVHLFRRWFYVYSQRESFTNTRADLDW